jgi:hypothetical protein
VHPSGAATETHTRRMGDKTRVTKRKKASDSEDWQLDSDSIQVSSQRQLEAEEMKHEPAASGAVPAGSTEVEAAVPTAAATKETTEPDFEEFDRDWNMMIKESWKPFKQQKSIEKGDQSKM